MDIERIEKIGHGSMGGKATGLDIVIKHMLNKEKEGTLPKIIEECVTVPKTSVLTSSFFDELIDSLPEYAKTEIDNAETGMGYDYMKIYLGIMETKLPVSLESELLKIAQNMKSPLAFRSSSLLEDGKGTSFAGKYDTLFVSHLGDLERRFELIKLAVKDVYASTYNNAAIEYRNRFKRLLNTREKMSIIVQDLVGKEYNGKFLPLVAGVLFTENPYRWSRELNNQDGMGRIVFGFGTMAVGREGASIYSLGNINNAPGGSTPLDRIVHSQKKVDVINLKSSVLETMNIEDLIINEKIHFPGSEELVFVKSVRDNNVNLYPPGSNWDISNGIVDFKRFLGSGDVGDYKFLEIQKALIPILREVLGGEVDSEYAFDGEKYNLLQGRLLSQRAEHRPGLIPDYVTKEFDRHVLFQADHDVPSRKLRDIGYIVYVDWQIYKGLKEQDRYAVRDIVGKINREFVDKKYVLIGPGRWGSEDHSLGVPVDFSHISNCIALVEYQRLNEDQDAPDASYGSHFFVDLVETGTIYVPLSPLAHGTKFRNDVFMEMGEIPEHDNQVAAQAVRVLNVRDKFGTVANLALNGKENEGVLYLKQSKHHYERLPT